ncbi:MAG: polysaccharide deacetylase family protein, partial [Bacteroidota bacterium]
SNASNARKNIPEILKLCDAYNIPITWATVGHLFLKSCSKDNSTIHSDLPRLPKLENNFWKYDGDDWFQNDPGTDYKTDPFWYAPDLIEQIQNAKTPHEIGCHTFSHIDCRDEVCSDEIFRAEINKCQKLAKEKNINLKSFVHPAHTIGNLDNLADLGFTNFRTDYANILGYPVKHENGLWEFQQTMEFTWYDYWSIQYQIKRYKKIIDRAIKSNTVCYFWFHPSMDRRIITKILPSVFQYLNKLNNKIWITTSKNYTNWLNEKQEPQQ